MAEVIQLHGSTTLEIPPDRVLDGAKTEELQTVFVVGWCKTGESYFASSTGDCAELLLLLELAKKSVMEQATD
jgi:hypothetical protein